MQNPALEKFLQLFPDVTELAQVSIQRDAESFELCHVENRDTKKESLKLTPESALRPLVDFTETKAFRPLKSAPNLQRGWRVIAANQEKLGFSLNTFYPNAIADWYAVNFCAAQPTDYREFTSRQTGMYRITTLLTDAQARPVIRACCHPKFCLKQRLWTVEGLAPDAAAEKSFIPCLEPCAILLEFARKAMRLEQATTAGTAPKAEESPEASEKIREADFENPRNPRRVQLEIEKKCL